MGKKDMDSSYRIAQELFKDRLRKQSPETLELLDDIHAADVIVVKGGYDHIEQVMDSADTPYTLIEPEMLDKARLRPDQVLFINCPGILDRDDTILQSVLDENDDPQWWLEGSSYPIKILDPERVRVLVQSKELKERHGEAPVFVSFDHGEGQVYHMISHFYLQRSETRTARHAKPSSDYLAAKGVAAADMPKFKEMGSDEFPTSDVESAYTSVAMVKAVLLKKKKQGKK